MICDDDPESYTKYNLRGSSQCVLRKVTDGSHDQQRLADSFPRPDSCPTAPPDSSPTAPLTHVSLQDLEASLSTICQGAIGTEEVSAMEQQVRKRERDYSPYPPASPAPMTGTCPSLLNLICSGSTPNLGLYPFLWFVRRISVPWMGPLLTALLSMFPSLQIPRTSFTSLRKPYRTPMHPTILTYFLT